MIEPNPNSRTRTSRQLNCSPRGLGRNQTQLFRSNITFAHRSNKSNALILTACTLHRNRSPSRLHRHPSPLVNPWLITVVDQTRCGARTLNTYVPSSWVYLRVIGCTRSQFDSCTSWRGTVSRRTCTISAASPKRNLSSARIRISTASIGWVQHIVVSKLDRTNSWVVAVRPKHYVSVVCQKRTRGNRLHISPTLHQHVRSRQCGGEILLQ